MGASCSRRDVVSDDELNSSTSGEEGARRVFLLRHGEAKHNVTDREVPDALLTARGRAQASAWRGCIDDFGAEVVLVSPLRRTVQTACLAFQDNDAPLELCRAARELWWEDSSNQPGTPDQLRRLLEQLPRGADVRRVDEALTPGPADPPNAQASVERLRCLLAARVEGTVAVTCHWGVINQLCGVSADNCDVVECELTDSGEFEVLTTHKAPLWRRGFTILPVPALCGGE